MKKNYSNNKNLVENLKKGNKDAYAYLMDTYYHKLCIYAQSLSRDIYISEDIVQNVFLRIWEQHDKLKETYSIKNYLYQSIYNEFINQYRKKNNLIAVETEYIKTLNTILEEDPKDIARLIALVKQEIQLLPPKSKKIFIMGKQEGLTYLEIAEHLNISFRTVENQMSKAFAIIRKKVGSKVDTILFMLLN